MSHVRDHRSSGSSCMALSPVRHVACIVITEITKGRTSARMLGGKVAMAISAMLTHAHRVVRGHELTFACDESADSTSAMLKSLAVAVTLAAY